LKTLLISLITAFTLLASQPVYAELCTRIESVEERTPNVEYDNWKHEYTIVLQESGPRITIEVFDYQKDYQKEDEFMRAGLFVDGCFVGNSFNPTREQVKEFLAFLINQGQQSNTGFSPVKFKV
jgi:hypothetical protein